MGEGMRRWPLMKLSLPLLLLVPSIALAQFAPTPPVQQVREQRVELLRDEIKMLDRQIEDRINKIIAGLSDITDSKDSRTKVARLKEQTIVSLQKNLENYHGKRAAILEQIRRPSLNLTADQKKTLLTALDSRVERRVQQILALQKSFPTSRDYDRYSVTSGDWDSSYRNNTDFQQNRRLSTHTNQLTDRTLKQLQDSIDRLEQQQRSLGTAAPGKLTTAELARNEALLNERRAQRAEILKGTPGQAGRAISLKQAVNLDAALRRANEELRRDFNTLFSRYNSLIPALVELNAVQTP